MKTYKVLYELFEVAEVHIDHKHPKLEQALADLVTFWIQVKSLPEIHESNLNVFLRMLGAYILDKRDLPPKCDGWPPLDGSCGILIEDGGYDILEYDPADFELREA